MKILALDHLVLTVADVEHTCAFYRRVLGMEAIAFGDGRRALGFGSQKINLHEHGREFSPKAARPTPGSADLCFPAATPIAAVLDHLHRESIPVEAGPVRRTGAQGALLSVYFRDPDGNLLEVSNLVTPATGPAQ